METIETTRPTPKDHKLTTFENGTAECSCQGWQLTGVTKASAITNHKLHRRHYEK